MSYPPAIELLRLESGKHGTFGVLKISKHVFCVTLEPPDMANQQNISCIPAGQYACQRRRSSFGETFEVMDVPKRSNIIFHPGNVEADTEGCILLAEHFGKLYGDRAVLNSGKTLDLFLSRLDGVDAFPLVISSHY